MCNSSFLSTKSVLSLFLLLTVITLNCGYAQDTPQTLITKISGEGRDTQVSSSQQDFTENSFTKAAAKLFQGIPGKAAIGFVELTGSNGEQTALASEIFQKIEPIILNEGMKKNLSFIERKDLKLIFDEWDLSSFGDMPDVGAKVLLGADYIITGKVRLDNNFVHCVLKLLHLENGQIAAVAEGYTRAQPHYYDWEKISKVTPEKAKNISNKEKSSDKIRLWTDKKEYQIGDAMEIFFEVTQPLYVQIIDVTPNGDITTIFPNPYQKESFCSPGNVYKIPPDNGDFILEVTPPSGIDRLKAIGNSSPISQETTIRTRGIQFTKKIVNSSEARTKLSFEIK